MLISNPQVAAYFETTVKATSTNAKIVNNWVTGDLLAALNKFNLEIEHSPVNAQQLGQLLDRIHDHTISGKNCENRI